MSDSLMKDHKEWFKEYMAIDSNRLGKEAAIIQAVDSDKVDAELVENVILGFASKTSVAKGFCSKCQDLFDNWPTLGGSSTRQHDSKPQPGGWEQTVARQCNTFELEAATRSGCRLCAFLLQSLKDSELLDIYRKVEVRLSSLGETASASLSVQNWGGNPIQLLWINLPGKVCTHCNYGMAVDAKVESRFLPVSDDCYDDPRDVLNISNQWLLTCTESHDLCKSINDGALPSRLILLSGESPRLVLTSDCADRPQYATLSHSWGSKDFLKLTSENMDSFIKAIPVELLPRSFTDAFEITQKLGLEYIWIDSLCIMQDSEEDWQKESALMRSVYGGSTITIAASSARDSTQGCFLKRPYFSGGLRARITDGGQQRVQDFRSSSEYNLSTSKTHLGSRAWALQERMLPPRTIHFGERGVFWECRTTITSEFLPDGFPKQLVSPLVRRKPGDKFEWLWPMIVRLYSAANLTFGKDKLPALSGIARMGHNETGDQYLAGLWRREIEEQLCWRLVTSESTAKRPPWRAPTWSWASVDGGVGWRKPQKGILETTYAHVLEASTTQHNHDPFGQVTSGMIRLAASGMITGYLTLSTKPSPDAEQEFNVVVRTGNEKQKFPILIDCLDEANPEDNESIYLVPLLSGRTGHAQKKEGGDYVQELMVQGVVLRHTGAAKGEYSRIGCFNIYKDRSIFSETEVDEVEVYEPFLRVLGEHGTSTAEAACKETIQNIDHPDERHIITLI